MKKAALIETLKNMPEEFSADELMERIVLLQKIDLGLLQIKEGNVLSQEAAEKKLDKWLK
ncbi:MAG: hypothetical protein EAZ15_09105 [Sphingobacteriales bacterium]|nr:MAG: hypothetical protein EAZ15_09105 [Sphingobacteriales bacterium]